MFTNNPKHLLKVKQNIILVILFMLIISNLLSQRTSNIILHAYGREVSGGAMQSTSNNPNGNKRPFYYYFIYLEVPARRLPFISSVYLNGDYYAVQVQKVKTPVIISNFNAENKEVKQTLVKQTKNQVYQLIVTVDNTNLSQPAIIKKQINSNEAFIKGLFGGKSFVLTKKKLNQLPVLLAQ